MKSTVEHLNPTRVKITVEVPFDELKPHFDKAYRRSPGRSGSPASGRARCRPGSSTPGSAAARCCPRWSTTRCRPSTARRSARTTDVTPLGQPDIEVTQIDDGDALAFTAEVDVRPEITLPALDSLAVTVDDVEVTDADVDRAAGRAARPVRHADRRRAAGGGRRLRADRPVRRRSTASRWRRPPPAGCPTRWARRPGRRHRRGDRSGCPPARRPPSPPRWSPASSPIGGRGDRHGHRGQGARAARGRRRLRPAGQRVRHGRRAARRPAPRRSAG